jgi:hypothetical protein
MEQRITKTISQTNFLFGRIEWFESQVKITWEGQSWHGYPGAPGREFFDSTYGRVEYFPANENGTKLPEGYYVEN